MAATDSPGGPPMAGDHPQRDGSQTQPPRGEKGLVYFERFLGLPGYKIVM